MGIQRMLTEVYLTNILRTCLGISFYPTCRIEVIGTVTADLITVLPSLRSPHTYLRLFLQNVESESATKMKKK